MKVVNLHQMISNNFVMRKASNAHYINSAKDTTTKWSWCDKEEKSNNLENGNKHVKNKKDVKGILDGRCNLCGLFNKSSTN